MARFDVYTKSVLSFNNALSVIQIFLNSAKFI